MLSIVLVLLLALVLVLVLLLEFVFVFALVLELGLADTRALPRAYFILYTSYCDILERIIGATNRQHRTCKRVVKRVAPQQ